MTASSNSSSRTALARALLPCLLFLLSIDSAPAREPGKSAPPTTCRGTDLVPSLAARHPGIHRDLKKAAEATINADAVLWRVTRPDRPGVAPSHLFGTVHVTDERLALKDPARRLVESATTLAVEVEDLSAAAVMKEVQKEPTLLVYADGQSLAGKLDAGELEILGKLLAPYGFPTQIVPIVRPWLSMMMLAVPMCEQRRTTSGLPVLDQQIVNAARLRKIPVVSLETLMQQMRKLAGLPDQTQVKYLKLALAYASERENQLETVIQAYLQRRLGYAIHVGKAMARAKGVKDYDQTHFNAALIDDRNRGMFKNSRPLVDKGGAFIAVGALHLVGGTGLVALYREAGYKVEAIE
ncbi:MAG: hypothetical protein RLZ98_3011 [Pseudomonadota bacterium]|jgi:uncharacterized protein YbaP (TraB family)